MYRFIYVPKRIRGRLCVSKRRIRIPLDTSIHLYTHTSINPYNIHPYILTSIHSSILAFIHSSVNPFILISIHLFMRASINYFSGREEGSHNPDFQEMARAINNIIGLSESGNIECIVQIKCYTLFERSYVYALVWYFIKISACIYFIFGKAKFVNLKT